MDDIIDNLIYAVTSTCALVGFIVIWNRIASVREADRQRQAFFAANPRSIVYPPPPRDYEAELSAMKDRAETAEWKISIATDEAIDAKNHAEYQAELAADAIEEAKELAARDPGYCLEDLTSFLEETVFEAERHWDAGLSEAERLSAWAEHWQQFDKPIADAMEAHARWMADIRARRRATPPEPLQD